MDLTETIVETSLYEGHSYMSKGGRKRWSQHVLWDDSLPGFGLRINSNNRKSFVVSYHADGRKRTKTLGRADTLPLAEARQRAAELLASNANGPPGEAGRPPIEGIETVAQLTDAYLEGHLKENASSWFADQRLMRTHIKPAMGRSPIAEVSQTDLANLCGRVARTFPADARRLKPLLNNMFDWAAGHGLWSRSSREEGSARLQPADEPAGPKSEAAAEPEVAPLPSAEELMASLQESDVRRRELAARLEEVSSSGVEMLVQLNKQAAAQKKLKAELASSRLQLEQANAAAAERPDPAKVEKQMANLSLSVEQLMESLSNAEGENGELAEKLAAAEARADAQTEKVVALARLRNKFETQALEEERQAAIRKVQKQGNGWQALAWVAAGVIGGVLVTLLLQNVFGRDDTASASAAGKPGSAVVVATGTSEASGAGLEPPPPTAPGSATGAVTPAGDASPVNDPRPDPAAAQAAVRAWAAAWSEQRVDDYLAAYSREFVPPDGLGHGEWAAQRRQRILRPTSIRVQVGAMTHAIDTDNRIRVSFEQSYETESYADQVLKTLELVWEDDRWKIAAERSR